MRHICMLFSLILACSAEQGFGTKDEISGSGGRGSIQVAPDEIVFDPTMVGHAETAAFRIDSVGEDSLRVTSVRIIDEGEMADVAVFTNLRAFDSVEVPFDLDPGESAEFTVTSTLPIAGSVTGKIEIDSSDPDVSDPLPGKVRINLSASAYEPGTGDDTGGEPTDDTGTSPSDDTGEATSEEEPTDDTGASEPSEPEDPETGGDTGSSD